MDILLGFNLKRVYTNKTCYRYQIFNVSKIKFF